VTRLFSDAELVELARPPRAQFQAAVAQSPEATRDALTRLAGRHLRFSRGYAPWLTALRDFLRSRHGADGLAAADAAEAVLQNAHPLRSADGVDEERIESTARRAAACVGAEDSAGALELWDELAQELLAEHDAQRDRISLYLSHVYRHYGVDELEACHRFCAERTLLQWMPRDLERDPASRLRTWAGMLLGNFSQLAIEEDEEKFSLLQSPCGTCSRQIEAGAHQPPLDLARVEEAGPLGFGEGDVPVYRSHVAVFHYLLPMERIGVPWPVIRCPRGQGTGTCRVLLYKDPSRTPSRHAAEAGMPRPESRGPLPESAGER